MYHLFGHTVQTHISYHTIILAKCFNDWINAKHHNYIHAVHYLCLLLFIELVTPLKKICIRWWITWMTYLHCAIGSCCIVLQYICIHLNSASRHFQHVASNKTLKMKMKDLCTLCCCISQPLQWKLQSTAYWTNCTSVPHSRIFTHIKLNMACTLTNHIKKWRMTLEH